VNQHLYLATDVYLKASSSLGEIDLSGTALNLQDSSFEINLPSTSDTLTINGNISCGDITSTNVTASQLLSSTSIDVSCSSFDIQTSSFGINMPSSSNTLAFNSNISCGTITSGNITSSQILNGTSNIQLLSSFPTSNTGTNLGLGVTWNNVGGLGEIDLIGMGQNGAGGFSFYSSSSSNAPVQLLTLYPNSGTYPGATFASGLPVKFNTTPTCPTMASGNSSTSIATTAFVQNAVSSVSTTGFSGTIELANNVEFDPSKASSYIIGVGPVYNLYNALFISFKTPFASGKVPTVTTNGTYTYVSTNSSGIVQNTNFNGFISVNLVTNNGFYVSVSTSSGARPSGNVYFNYIAALA
jgi:hypothetical protein